MASSCHIVCFGNELHGDDGFGAAVHRRLEQMPLPDGLRLFRADTSGPAALACLEDCDYAVLVDAVAGFGPPGSLHCLATDRVALEGGLSGHGFGVGGLLELAKAVLPRPPGMCLVGVEASNLHAFSCELSPDVAASLAAAIDLVLHTAQHELASLA